MVRVNRMVNKMSIPCLKCPVLAICMGKKNIDCQILVDYLGSIKNSRVNYIKAVRSIQETFKKSIIVFNFNNQKVNTDRKEIETKTSNICYWGNDA